MMKNEDFRELIKQHIWYVYTNGKIGKEWKVPKNYPMEQIKCFTNRQAFLAGMIMGQLWARKEDDNFTGIYGIDYMNIKISRLIIVSIAEIPWDSVKWEPNEETKQAMRDARAGIGLKEFSTIEELFEDLHIDEEVSDER